MKFIFGPVPSRRLGLSLGVSPIPKGHCNYSCIYCQLGRTSAMTNTVKSFFNPQEIVAEVKDYISKDFKFDVITVVGEGEPLLYRDLDIIINDIKKLTEKPVAVITNGALLYEKSVRENIKNADIVLPSFDSPDKNTWKKINRPFGKITFEDSVNGIIKFSEEFKGQIWIEIMLIKGINDDRESILNFKNILKQIKYDKIYINVPLRAPAEQWVEIPEKENLEFAVKTLGAISMENINSDNFFSEEKDDIQAVISIIKRHPMNQYEIKSFLESRKNNYPEVIISELEKNSEISVIEYKGYKTYRLK